MVLSVLCLRYHTKPGNNQFIMVVMQQSTLIYIYICLFGNKTKTMINRYKLNRFVLINYQQLKHYGNTHISKKLFVEQSSLRLIFQCFFCQRSVMPSIAEVKSIRETLKDREGSLLSLCRVGFVF